MTESNVIMLSQDDEDEEDAMEEIRQQIAEVDSPILEAKLNWLWLTFGYRITGKSQK